MSLRVGELHALLGLDSRPFDVGLASSKAKMASFSGSLQKDMGKAGKFLTLGLTAPLGLAAFASVKTAGTFEQSMNTMGAVAGVPQKELEKLGGLAKQLGADTVFSANESAAAMVELAKAGIDPANIKAGALTNTLDLAAAGELELARAAEITANAMNVFGLEGEKSKEAVDALAGAANASSSNVEDLAMALSMGGTAAASVNWTIQETTAALAALADNGIKGSDAGTSLKTMLLNLEPNTARARDTMSKYNVELTNADGTYKSLTEVGGELQEKLGHLSDAERNLALQAMFGTDAFRAANIVMKEGSEGLAEYEKETSKVGNAQKVAEARMKGWQGVAEQLMGSLETVGLAVGEILIPPLTILANTLKGVLDGFLVLPQPIQTGIVVMAGLAAAAGPAMWAVHGLGRAIAFFRATEVAGGIIQMSRFGAVVGEVAVGAGTAAGKVGTLAARFGGLTLGLGAVTLGLAAMVKEASDAEAKIADLQAVVEDFGLQSGKGSTAAREIRDEINRLGEASLGMDNTMGMVNNELSENEERLRALDRAYTIAKQPIDAWAVAMLEARDTTRAAERASYSTANQTEETGRKIRAFAGMTKKEFGDWREESTEALNGVSGVLGRLAGKAELSSARILSAFSKQVEDMRDYERNWSRLLERGLPDSLAKQLQDMGLEGASVVRALAGANRKEFDDIIAKWEQGEKISGRTADAIAGDFDKTKGKAGEVTGAVDRYTIALKDIPQHRTTRIETPGLSTAKRDAASLYNSLEDITSMGTIRAEFAGGFGGPSGGYGSAPGGTSTAAMVSAMAAVPGAQSITSGYRPWDTGSFHSVAPPFNAVDAAGENLEALWATLLRRRPREMILDHMISENGSTGYYAPSDHTGANRHVHFMLAGGGTIHEPVIGRGMRTGATYSMGEKESETLLNRAQTMALNRALEGGDIQALEDVFVRALRRAGNIANVDAANSLFVGVDGVKGFAETVQESNDRRQVLMTGRRS